MKKILLIEDNDDIRNNTAEILELSNYKVFTAENGKTGIEKAIRFKPDLIICDIMMPLLDGFGVLQAVHQNDGIRCTPFIFLTAKTERIDFRRGMESGADDYITKPFTGTELLNAVHSRLEKAELLRLELSPALEDLSDLLKSSNCTEALLALTEGRNINKFKRKQTIYTEGNHPLRLYSVIRGKVKGYKTNEDGKELVTDLYSPGDFLGHIALLEGTVYKDTTVAIEDTELAVIPKKDFDELINKNADVAKKFIQLLARNISEKEEHLLGLAYNSLRKKVADALLTLQKKYQVNNNEKYSIHISREILATIAGTATESMIRTLTDFKAERLIEIKEGNITILQPEKLEKLVN